jgi:uncharacterized protein DUF7010
VRLVPGQMGIVLADHTDRFDQSDHGSRSRRSQARVRCDDDDEKDQPTLRLTDRDMLVRDAQSEVRRVYLGGLIGNLVSGTLWLASAFLAVWDSQKAAIILLVVGGFFIYPALSLVLRILGKPASLSSANPFRFFAIQVAFVLPLSMPLVAPVVAYRAVWFYPAMMVLVGAHYLPFATLYGMRTFLFLAALLIACGIAIALYVPANFSLGGWVAGVILLVFAVAGYVEMRRTT